jgi:GNAT superfamily N-acetyltransferase
MQAKQVEKVGRPDIDQFGGSKMNIEIKKLTPDLAEDYVHFFDRAPHSERPDDDECKCYCVWWCKDDHDAESMTFLLPKERRKDYALQSVRNGSIQGYLAYCDGKVVAWCNANTKADCLKCYCWRRMGSVSTEELASGVQVKSVFCFLTAPDMRKKGITKLLLERVCQDALQDGFDFVEAYPKKRFINEAENFMGPVELFIKGGFAVHSETEDKLVMRKPLSFEPSWSAKTAPAGSSSPSATPPMPSAKPPRSTSAPAESSSS